MKSDHRRDLHANELEKLTQSIGKFFERHGMKVLMGLGAAIVVGVGAYFAWNWGGKTAEAASGQVFKAEAASDLLLVADNRDYDNLPLQIYARLTAAERQLDDALQLYVTSKKGGLPDLKEVLENFEKVLAAKGLSSDAKERALRGKAYCLEIMSGGDTTEAVTAYQTYLKEFPDTRWKKLVEERIAALKTKRAQELYAFLASDDRKPADRKKPSDLEQLRKIPGHENLVTGGERPVELPPIPGRLLRGLSPEGGAKPFPKGAPEGDGKNKPDNASGPAFPKVTPEKTPGKPKPEKAKPFKAPAKKTEANKTAAKKSPAPK